MPFDLDGDELPPPFHLPVSVGKGIPHMPPSSSLTYSQSPLPPPPSRRHIHHHQQKPRCSASAAAFMRGATDLAYSLTMEPLDDDPLLRFFDTCPAYADFKDTVGDCLVSAT